MAGVLQQELRRVKRWTLGKPSPARRMTEGDGHYSDTYRLLNSDRSHQGVE